MATHALEAVELVKTYPAGRKKPPLRALDGLSFSVGEGIVLGLLGPNGAGKSTTVKILTTLSRADSGTARVAGHDVNADQDQVRRSIGYIPQKSSADPVATGIENLVLSGRIHGLSRAEATRRATELLDRFGLAEYGSRPVRTYSGGMQRKLDVAIGLVHRPRVLFLDEPTTGLDPEARADLWTEVQQLAGAEGLTVLLTTHYLEEADRLADQLAIVDNGKVVAEGTPESLKAELHGDTIQIELADLLHPTSHPDPLHPTSRPDPLHPTNRPGPVDSTGAASGRDPHSPPATHRVPDPTTGPGRFSGPTTGSTRSPGPTTGPGRLSDRTTGSSRSRDHEAESGSRSDRRTERDLRRDSGVEDRRGGRGLGGLTSGAEPDPVRAAGAASAEVVRELLGRLPGIDEVIAEGKFLRARVGHGATAVPAILAALEERAVPVVAVTVSRPSLDDVYLRYTGRSFREAERINDEGQAA